jgi:hypothetical protein
MAGRRKFQRGHGQFWRAEEYDAHQTDPVI